LEKFAQKEVDSGRYSSAAEVIIEALRVLEEQEKARNSEIAQFRSEVDRRLASLDAGESVDGEEFFEALRHKSEARRKKRA